MDSTSRPPALRPPAVHEATPPASARPAGVPRRALARLGRVLPAAEALARFSYRTSAVSALAAAVVVAAVADRLGWDRVTPGALLLGMALLGVPALAAALVGWTLADLARLPGEIRAAATDAAHDLRAGGRPRGLVGVLSAVWAARSLVVASRDGWWRALAAARLLRLASLPVVLLALGLFLLNGVVVLGGIVALFFLLL